MLVVLGVFMALQLAGMLWGFITDINTGWFLRYILAGGNIVEHHPLDDFDFPAEYESFVPLILIKFIKLAAHFLFDASVLMIVLLCGLPAIRRRESPQFYFLWKWFAYLLKTTVIFMFVSDYCYDETTVPVLYTATLSSSYLYAMLIVLMAYFGVIFNILKVKNIYWWTAKG